MITIDPYSLNLTLKSHITVLTLNFMYYGLHLQCANNCQAQYLTSKQFYNIETFLCSRFLKGCLKVPNGRQVNDNKKQIKFLLHTWSLFSVFACILDRFNNTAHCGTSESKKALIEMVFCLAVLFYLKGLRIRASY